MRRSLITGFFVVAFTATAFGLASADETAPLKTTSVHTTQMVALAPASDAAAPTADADLAMWNAAPAAAPAKSEKHLSVVRRFASGIMARTAAIASNLTRSAMRFIGTPYVFGGTTTSGFDCSGYVQHVFAMIGVHLPRTADAQFDVGQRVASAAMVPGDLVFFHTYASGVSHVGIYLGNDKFISSSSRGVSVSSLHESYWAARYLGAKRVVAAN